MLEQIICGLYGASLIVALIYCAGTISKIRTVEFPNKYQKVFLALFDLSFNVMIPLYVSVVLTAFFQMWLLVHMLTR